MDVSKFLVAFSLLIFSISGYGSDYVGSDACIDCHQKEYQAWQGSDHERAMLHASVDSVLGDFNNASLESKGEPSRFFKKGEEYWVNIQGPDDKFQDYKISYTFGHYPLQQYMVEFDDGRVQLIPFAWDSRAEAEGGQRWFNLYPDLNKHDDFYWTNAGQNWNFMCADCHSTNLQKRYDSASDQYDTTYSEINVGCEACHGPASKHLEWAEKKSLANHEHMGFERDLSKAVKQWVMKEGKSTFQPEGVHATDQMKVCAQCHSRRTQLTENADHVKTGFLDKYRLSLISPELYHHDGQIFDEDYVYGSYLQSKMADKGVSCTNCHDPHTSKLAIPQEAVCAQCHIPTEFTPENHTFHEAGSEASQCVTCHMPQTTYMQVDPRRDHSWKVPRPDLSEHLGTPNVCTDCHSDQTNKWAAEKVKSWFPNSQRYNEKHFAIAFYAADIGYRGAEDALSLTAQDANQKDIIRASALSRMAPYSGKNTTVALARAVKHESELIRFGAIEGSQSFEFKDRWQILKPLLSDPVLAVRTEAAGALVSNWQQMSSEQRKALEPALEEYIDIQEFNADRGFGRTNLGNIYSAQGKYDQAIEAYLGAIKVEPIFANSYVNLAELYRQQGNEVKAFQTLEQGMAAQPNSGALKYSAALSLLRQDQKVQATEMLRLSTEAEPQNSQYWFLYGLALETADLSKASQALDKAFRLSGNPQQLYAKCEMLVKYSDNMVEEFEARKCLSELEKYAPPNIIAPLRNKLLR